MMAEFLYTFKLIFALFIFAVGNDNNWTGEIEIKENNKNLSNKFQ